MQRVLLVSAVMAVASWAAPAVAAPTPLSPPGGEVSNPSVYDGEAGAGPVKRSKLTNGKCIGFVHEEPNHTLKIPATAAGNFSVSVDGLGLWIMKEDKRFWCGDKSIVFDAKSIAGQTVKVWLVHGMDDPKKPYRLRVEDLVAPLSPPWTATTPVLTIDGEAPQVATGRVAATGKHEIMQLARITGCPGTLWNPRPLAVLDFEQGAKNTPIATATDEEMRDRVLVMGPYDGKTRHPFARCVKMEDKVTLDPGRYAVFFPSHEPKPGLASVRVGAASSPPVVAANVGTVTKTPSERALNLLAPGYGANDALVKFKQDWRGRLALAEGLPRGAFVYPSRDLDSSSAKPKVDGPGEGERGYPKADEPLIVIKGGGTATVLTVDGLLFSVAEGDLTVAPKGPAAVPAAPRAWLIELPGWLAKGPEADKISAPYTKVIEKESACAERIMAKVSPGSSVTYSEGGVSYKFVNLKAQDRAERMIESKCDFGREKVKAARDKKLRALLIEERAAAYADLLPKLRAKFTP